MGGNMTFNHVAQDGIMGDTSFRDTLNFNFTQARGVIEEIDTRSLYAKMFAHCIHDSELEFLLIPSTCDRIK
jgi:hypothetical protein